MGQQNGILVFFVGCLGAFAPEIARLYQLRHKPFEKFSSWYFVISFIYALFGGVIAVILPATTLWAAFYAGVTWPAVISIAFRNRTKPINFNDPKDFIIKAKEVIPQKPSSFSVFIEKIRDHADGL